MKRILQVIFGIAAAAGLAACGSSDNSNNLPPNAYCVPGQACVLGPQILSVGPVRYVGPLTNVDSGRAQTIANGMSGTLFYAGTNSYNSGFITITLNPVPGGSSYWVDLFLGGSYNPYYNASFSIGVNGGGGGGPATVSGGANYFPIPGGSQLRFQNGIIGWRFDVISSGGPLDGSTAPGTSINGVEIQWTEITKGRTMHLANSVLTRQ